MKTDASADSAEEKEHRRLYSQLTPDVLYPLKLPTSLCLQSHCGLNSAAFVSLLEGKSAARL